MKTKKSKKIRALKLAITVLLCLILAVLLFILGAVISLVIKFYGGTFESQVPVERTDEYSRPDYPTLDSDPGISWDYGIDLTPGTETTDSPTSQEQSTAQPEITTEEETTLSPDDSTLEPEVTTSPDDTTLLSPPDDTTLPSPPDDTTKSPEVTTKPIVTSPPVVTTWPGGTEPSFGNSSNAVSVYNKKYPIYKVEQKDPNVVNILVLGTDSRNVLADRGHSDTMIIVSYNRKTAQIKLTSLMRDALVPIEGHDWNRINTAYMYGGVGLAINTINQLFDLDIQQFIVIDFNGVKNFIDYIGGVELTFTQDEVDLYNQYWGTNLAPGTHHCDSNRVMAHLQNRSSPAGDFDRIRRQQDTVKAIANKILKEKSLAEIYDIIEYAMGIVRTNIGLTELFSYATSVVGNASKLEVTTQSVPYRDSFKFAWYKGMSIISFDIEKAAVRLNEFIYG